jgi:hypothetical protein
MIYINHTFRNPWSDRFELLYGFAKTLTKNKALEIEAYRSDTILEYEIKFTIREDHSGLTIGLGLLSYTIRLQIYDTRHWNYATKSWEVYES